jgi:hypothetical protein
VSSNRAHGAAGQNRSCSFKGAGQQETSVNDIQEKATPNLFKPVVVHQSRSVDSLAFLARTYTTCDAKATIFDSRSRHTWQLLGKSKMGRKKRQSAEKFIQIPTVPRAVRPFEC